MHTPHGRSTSRNPLRTRRLKRPLGALAALALAISGAHMLPASAAVAPPTGQVTTFLSNAYGSNGMVFGPDGVMYVADTSGNRIRKVATDGTVTTLAGSGAGFTNGTGTNATFRTPTGVALDSVGDVIVADRENGAVRKVTPGGAVTTLAQSLGQPAAVVVDRDGTVLVAEMQNNRITRIMQDGTVVPFAGSVASGSADGTGTAATFSNPRGLALASNGDLYVLDSGNSAVRRVTPAGAVTTFATGFSFTLGMTVSSTGIVYVSEYFLHQIKQVAPSGTVSVLSGNGAGFVDGSLTAARFNGPVGLAVDASDHLYVADTNNNRMRLITLDAPPTSSTTVAPSTTITPSTTSTPSTTIAPSTTGLTTTTAAPAIPSVPFVPADTVAPVAPVAPSTTVPAPTIGTPTTTADTLPSAEPTTAPGTLPPTTVAATAAITLDHDEVAAGQAVTVKGSGYEPGTTVDVELHSTPIHLGTAKVAADGTFVFLTQLPAGVVGNHEIVAIGMSAAGQPRTVTAAVTLYQTRDLAFTGVDTTLALYAMVLLTAGLALLTVARRRLDV